MSDTVVNSFRDALAALSKGEQLVIGCIVAMAAQLPNPLSSYTEALSQMRREYFGVPGRSRGEVTKGYIDGHQIRVTAPEWKGMK